MGQSSAIIDAHMVLSTLAKLPALSRGRELLERSDAQTIRRQVSLCETPAPTGAEGPRADRAAGIMRDIGLEAVTIDEVGNVIGWRGRPNGVPAVVLAA